jgi:hypothetical protein
MGTQVEAQHQIPVEPVTYFFDCWLLVALNIESAQMLASRHAGLPVTKLP